LNTVAFYAYFPQENDWPWLFIIEIFILILNNIISQMYSMPSAYEG